MKELVVAGGANGTGKTTFSLAYARLRSIPYLGADAIAQEMAPNAPASVAAAACTELLRRLQQRLAGHESFVLESTFSGRTLKHSLASAHPKFLGIVSPFGRFVGLGRQWRRFGD